MEEEAFMAGRRKAQQKQGRRCWCQNDDLSSFSPEYLKCARCETLVVARDVDPRGLVVSDDERDFYGHNYFSSYQIEKCRLPPISERSRTDLPERCLHWLRTVLRYKVPPGKILELGSSHGGFVAVLRWAGFDATGLDLSPWVVDFARKTFGIPMLLGPIEQQALEPRSLDAVVLMDVLEHLADPVATMGHALNLLKLDGIVLIQTPCYPEGRTYEQMLAENDPFLRMMIPDQHLYLFSRRSVGMLLRQLGAEQQQFEPAIFPDYDMFVAASPSPIAVVDEGTLERALLATPTGRMTCALLDLNKRFQELQAHYQESEADRAARLQLIENSGRKLAEMDEAGKRLQERVAGLQIQCQISDADRAARLSEIDAHRAHLADLGNERNNMAAQCLALRKELDEAEADRAARLEKIHELDRLLAEANTDRTARLSEIEAHRAHLAELANERNNLAAQCVTLQKQLDEAEADRTARLERIHELDRFLAEANTDRAARLSEIEAHRAHLADLGDERNSLAAQCAALQKQLDEAEADRAAKTESTEKLEELRTGVEVQKAHLAKWEALCKELGAQRDRLQQRLTELEAVREVDGISGAKRIAALENMLADANAEWVTRLQIMEFQEQRLSELEQLRRDLTARCEHLETALNQVKAEQLDELAKTRKQAENQLAAANLILNRLPHSYIVQLMRAFGLWKWVVLPKPRSTTSPAASGNARQLRRICVDLTPVLPGGANGGAKVMTLDLLRNVSKLAPACEIVLLTSGKSHEELSHMDARNVRRLCVADIGVASRSNAAFPQRIKKRLHRLLTAVLPSPILKRLEHWHEESAVTPGRSRLLRDLEADLLFCPFTAPFFFDPSVPVVSVLYDLQYRYYPQFFEAQDCNHRDAVFRTAVKVASKIVCISEYVRQTVLENSNLSPDRVETIPISLQHRIQKPPDTAIQNVLRRYGLSPERFLFYPANFWAHKNHEQLLTAFGMYSHLHPESDLKLVLTGAPGSSMERVRHAAEKMGLGAKVVFPGYVSNEEISSLMRSCKALIFPSLYEGFGIPVLEAMSVGTPVLCSRITSLPEVAGDAALYFDPRKPSEIASAIERIEADPEYARALVQKGTQRVGVFASPAEMALKYLQVFQAAVETRLDLDPGVHSVYPDGWIGNRCVITFGRGSAERKLMIQLFVPEWVPTDLVSVSMWPPLSAGQEIYSIKRGQNATLQRALPLESGFVEIVCDPVFQPKACGMGEDERGVSCMFHSARVVSSDGSVSILEPSGDAL
jgi:glycosyltransferase involved in cell wall biosynthesis/2-polyprenyl-3-methyl-5-hydroxy-6-metoxy-1,4-benzoquinol methylase